MKIHQKLFTFLAVFSILCNTLMAVNNSIPPHKDHVFSGSLKTIPRELDVALAEKQGLLDWNPIEPLHEYWYRVYKYFKDNYNLELGTAYTTLYQRATSGITHQEAAGGDFDFFGEWIIADKQQLHPCSIGFSSELRSRYTNIPPRLLGDAIGSLWGTTSVFSEYEYNLVQIWSKYHIIRKKFGFMLGKIDLTDYFNSYSFISSNSGFLNKGLTGDLTIAFPDNGLTLIMAYKPTEDSFIFGTIADANGDRTTFSFDTFFRKHEYFSAVEFAIKPKVCGWGTGIYNLMLWHRDARKEEFQPSTWGLAISCEQAIGDGLVPFVRYGYSDGDVTAVEHAIGTGFGIKEPFARKDDQFGFGMVWGRPRDEGLRDQFCFETYYRLQFTHHIEITPDIELFVNPTFNTHQGLIGVFSVRARVSL